MPGVWEEMTNEQRVSSVHFDFMRHNEMALFAGVLMMGKVQFKPVGTAATDGLDVYYDPTFWRGLTREEARFTVGHEVSHKALKHCTHYKEACEKFPQLSNIAMDYVVNGLLHQADPGWKWMSPPKSIKIYIDPKYYNWSFPRVLMDLVNKQKEGSMEGGCAPFDQHMPGEQSAEATQKTAKEIEEALRQGQIIAKANRSRSNKGSGGALAVESFIESKTNWTQYLRDFVTTALRGTDVARWSRINTRMFAATGGQVALPTLYNETTGHVGIFADTSASMARTYPLRRSRAHHEVGKTREGNATLVGYQGCPCTGVSAGSVRLDPYSAQARRWWRYFSAVRGGLHRRQRLAVPMLYLADRWFDRQGTGRDALPAVVGGSEQPRLCCSLRADHSHLYHLKGLQ
jgi:predicted metal-dependent peptidase